MITGSRPAKSDDTVMLSVAHLVSSSTALAFLTSVSEKHNSTSPTAIHVKNLQNEISIEGKLDLISRLE
jgi:hypothetical protein